MELFIVADHTLVSTGGGQKPGPLLKSWDPSLSSSLLFLQ